MASNRVMARAPGAVALLLFATCLVLAASARPLKLSLEGDGVRTVESPAGDIQPVVSTDGAGDRGGHKFMMSIDMLGGMKDSGPSPGAGH
jgi:hypothetical protein